MQKEGVTRGKGSAAPHRYWRVSQRCSPQDQHSDSWPRSLHHLPGFLVHQGKLQTQTEWKAESRLQSSAYAVACLSSRMPQLWQSGPGQNHSWWTANTDWLWQGLRITFVAFLPTSHGLRLPPQHHLENPTPPRLSLISLHICWGWRKQQKVLLQRDGGTRRDFRASLSGWAPGPESRSFQGGF